MSKTEILKAAVIENLNKPIEERMTGKRLGELHGVSGARISQIASGLKVKPVEVSAPTQETALAPEAA